MSVKFYNPSIMVSGVDLSADAKEITFDQSTEVLEVTTFGDEHKIKKPGLRDTTISVTFVRDSGTDLLESTLGPLYNDGGEFSFEWQADKLAGTSSSNPKYSCTAWISSYPAGGSHGQLRESQVTFETASVITRSTSA